MKQKLIFTLSFIFLACISGHANLYINEVNSTGKWIEIYNSSDELVDVSGDSIIRNNNDGAVSKSVIPEGIYIGPKSFLVLYQSSASSPVVGALGCLTYGISADKFMSAVLTDKQGNIIDDAFDIGNPQTVTVSAGKSWARKTDGVSTIVALDPTPGKSNEVPPAFSELKIYINEVNSTGKWIEIYNDEEDAVNIGRYTVTRNNNDNAAGTATMPTGTSIPAKGFLVLYQGSESGGSSPSPVEGAIDCLSFGISSDKFMSVVLKDEEGNIVDNTFVIGNPQTVMVSGGKSWARETDGAASVAALEPTPGKSNVLQPFSELKIYINEVNSTGKWIEIYNDENDAVDIGGYTVTRSNSTGSPSVATIPSGTVIASKGFLVIYQGSESGGSSPAPVEGAIDCLSYGISSDKFMNAVLKDNQGNVIDNTFDIGNPQAVTVSDGKSWARETDGSETVVAQSATPGLRNGMTTGLTSGKAENVLVSICAGIVWLPEETSYIQLYSAAGILVLDQSVTGASIDLTNLPQGFYIVKLTVSGKLFTQKVIR